MQMIRCCILLFSLCGFVTTQIADGQERKSRVSPVLEIEIIDPNVDARGNPAVTLTRDANGAQQVEIPPALIVHRYFYNGDRSFRGPDMPGGPCIIVAQNPRDGQQTYLPIQMLPGSPVVHYTARSIEYNFGDRAITVSFPKIGDPKVSYRSGRTWSQKASSLVGWNHIQESLDKTGTSLHRFGSKTKSLATGASHAAQDSLRTITLPAQNMARFIPGAAALTDPTLEAKIIERQAIQDQERAKRTVTQQASINEIDIKKR